MEDLSGQIRYNWNYQYSLGKDVLVPFLTKKNVFHTGDNVFEVGCGEGGVLTTFAEAGVQKAIGTDIHQERLVYGRDFIKEKGQVIELSSHNILEEEIPDEWAQQFDLVLLRDVIEHLTDTGLALKRIKRLLKPGGYLFVTFPPFYSPFGAHQHTLKNFWGKFPYIQFLPKPLFIKMIRSEKLRDVEEVTRINTIKLSPGKFKTAALSCGYQIFSEEYYILRPVFKMKFGLPEVKLPNVLNHTFFQNTCSTEANFILRVPENA